MVHNIAEFNLRMLSDERGHLIYTGNLMTQGDEEHGIICIHNGFAEVSGKVSKTWT